MRLSKLILIILIALFSFIVFPISHLSAQEDFKQVEPSKEETLEANVIKVLEEKEPYQKLELFITKGLLNGATVVVENGVIPLANIQKYQVGDRVIVNYSTDFEGNDFFYIIDYIRRDSLLQLFIIFVVLVVLIASWRGVASLIGMGVSFLIIFQFILPKILAGGEPIQIAIIGSMLIIPITFYFSHGFNKKTTIAIIGTIISLIITGILAGFFVESSKLTGFVSEEAGFLQIDKEGSLNIKGLLLAGIIIGVLGVLDDVTISQSAIVFQLKKVDPKLKFEELYRRSMDVGRDHISSMVNTLILVYTGVALPLLLIFVDNPHPFSEIINYEIIADEVVRTLVGSIGLVLAVPITTIIAVLFVEKRNKL
ncbi:YibE/F family protein [Patescibacteria group bacterium]|nr:YibE/F family protein [Patescibacteria group bacterium]